MCCENHNVSGDQPIYVKTLYHDNGSCRWIERFFFHVCFLKMTVKMAIVLLMKVQIRNDVSLPGSLSSGYSRHPGNGGDEGGFHDETKRDNDDNSNKAVREVLRRRKFLFL